MTMPPSRGIARRVAAIVFVCHGATVTQAAPGLKRPVSPATGDAAQAALHCCRLDPRHGGSGLSLVDVEGVDITPALDPAVPGVPARLGDPRWADLLAQQDLHRLQRALNSRAATSRPSGRAWLKQVTGEVGSEAADDVPPAFRPSLQRWLRAMLRSLRASSVETVFSADPATRVIVSQALQTHRRLYQAYALERDAFERRRDENRRAVERARKSPNGKPLVQQVVARFDPVQDTRHVLLRAHPALRQQTVLLARSGVEVLRCRYGPSGLWADGTPRYDEVRFWYRRPPAQIDVLLGLDPEGALGALGHAGALAACPADQRWPRPRKTLSDPEMD